MRDRGRAVRIWGFGRRARPLAVVLLSSALAACGLQRASRPAESLPLAVHHGVAGVAVVVRSAGAVQVATAGAGWDGTAPEALHEALRGSVAAEARALGLSLVELVDGDLPVTPRPSAPPDQADPNDPAAMSREAPRPSPPPGVAWLEVRLVRADLEAVGDGDAPALLSARFEARVTAAAEGRGGGWHGPWSAERTFSLRDPAPRTGAGWGADSGAAVQAGLERLVARAARRVAVDLLATASDGTGDTGLADCGPAPRRGRTMPGDTRPPRPEGPAWARWEAWTPRLPAGTAAEIGYDLRAWRLEPNGRAVVVLEADDLSQTSARLSPPGAPAAAYAWSVRAVARLADGRRIRSRWSQAQLGPDHCASDPDPWLARREEAAGPRPAIPAAPADDPRVSVDYRPMTWQVQRQGLGPELTAGSGAGQGLVAGAGGGFQASVACGPFFPVCAVVLVPAGAVLGLTVGAVVGGVNGAARSTSRTEAAALAPEPVRGALLAALEREAHDPALLTALRAAAGAGLGDGAAGLGLEAVELTLIGHPGETLSARLQLAVAGTLRRDGAPPASRRVDVITFASSEVADLADGGGEALALLVRAQAPEAGRRLAASLLAPDPPPAPQAASPAPAGAEDVPTPGASWGSPDGR